MNEECNGGMNQERWCANVQLSALACQGFTIRANEAFSIPLSQHIGA